MRVRNKPRLIRKAGSRGMFVSLLMNNVYRVANIYFRPEVVNKRSQTHPTPDKVFAGTGENSNLPDHGFYVVLLTGREREVAKPIPFIEPCD